MIFVIFILAIFFALNMGGASFAASFAASYGGKILSKKKASLYFILFVILGAVIFGKNVSLTLGEELIPSELLGPKSIMVIFLAAGLSMFISNVMNIPQSTSLVTVAAIAGVGAYWGQLSVKTIYYFMPFWILLPVISYVLTFFVAGYVYPPRKKNFWIYQKFVNQKNRLRQFVIVASCYNAFSVGTNNVANVVGPFVGWGQVPWERFFQGSYSLVQLLLIFAVVYGLGSLIFAGPIKTAGQKIVPLGLLTASIISLISGTLMIIASCFGIPQSFVMLQMAALFAIATLKEGPDVTFNSSIARRTFYTWTINPVITFCVSLGLCYLFIR